MKEKQKEVLVHSTLIRKEVFDMADTMDIMAQVMHCQGDKVALI